AGVIAVDDPEAGPGAARLEDRRIADLVSRGDSLVEGLDWDGPRLGDPGRGQARPGLSLVTQPPDHGWVAIAQPKRLGDVRGGQNAPLVPAEHAADGLALVHRQRLTRHRLAVDGAGQHRPA